MPGLSRSIVEHRLPIKPGVRPHQQPPRRCKADMLEPVKAEIMRLYDAGFICPCRYAEWVSSIVPVIKKNGKVSVSAGQFLGFLVHERGIEITQRSIKAIKKIKPPENKTELLRHYLLSNECTVICKADAVKYMLSAPILKGRVGKWIFSLPEFDLRQLAGEYECKNDMLMVYNEKCQELMKEFRLVTLKHVSREQNIEANDLAQGASGYKPMVKDVKVEVAAITGDDWRYGVYRYLQDPSQSASRKLRYKALKYTLLDDDLYYRTIDGVLVKCLSADQAKVAIGEVHEGICGTHQSAHKVKWLLRRAGYFWPTMLEDCFRYYKGCQDCQKFGAIQRAPASAMNPIIKPWPFRCWGIDMIADEYYNLMADEREDLVQSRLLALAKVTKDKERIARHYNKKVVPKDFSEGELVWKLILPIGTRDSKFGKWSRNWEGSFQIYKVVSKGAYMLQGLDGEVYGRALNGKYLKKYYPSVWVNA
uniref:Retrotransposon protein, putative, unclassified n=1 Tax=Oryza sativa subsp. japonica TaxID=39947 RepID=Q33AL2_ORYSJ|nr:retrotransposon protein, putative, unclassified [Oryza sativa Japonica Group]